MEDEFSNQVDALAQIEILKKVWASKTIERNSNSHSAVIVSRKQHDANKTFLKSDLKKTTAFVKKLRSINTEGLQQCIRDSESLNLGLYISEIVGALLEITFKATDVAMIVKLCTSLHRRYEEFTNPLINGLKSGIVNPPPEDDKDSGKKKRIQIRFITELFEVGVVTDEDFFCQLLRALIGRSKGHSGKQTIDLLGLSTFVKYGSEILLGYPTRRSLSLQRGAGKQSVNDEPLVNLLVSTRTNIELRSLISEIYDQLSGNLISAHRDYFAKEKRMEKDRLVHGTLSENKQLDLDNSKRLYEKLLSVVTGLSESTGQDMPLLELEKDDDDGTKGISVWDGGAAGAASGDCGPFGDTETRAFYEDLPDLLSLVPLTSLGVTPEQAAAMREEWRAAKEKSYCGDPASLVVTDEVTGPTAGELEDTAASEQSQEQLLDDDQEDCVGAAAVSSSSASVVTSVTAGKASGTEDAPHIRLTALLEKLPECTNKARADEFSVNFCNLTSKGARKKLQAALLYVPRSRLELTATYSRIIASIARIFPDFAAPILEALSKEFMGMTRNKATAVSHTEGKMKNIRYAGELVKFGIAPPITAFKMFKTFLTEFTPQHVELMCVLLETCGRFLYLLPYTHERTAEVLETMLRLRRARNLDVRTQNLIEGAYFAVKPPERAGKKSKTLTTLQKYIRHLVLSRLCTRDVCIDDIIKSMRRLPWSTEEPVALSVSSQRHSQSAAIAASPADTTDTTTDQQPASSPLDDADVTVEAEVVKCIFKITRTKYVSITAAADCISGLMRPCPNLIVMLVDRIYEEIQRSMETPHKREPQRMTGLARLYGELYNFEVLSSTAIFDLLYHLVSFDHLIPIDSTAPRNLSSAMDFGFKYDGSKFNPNVVSELDSPTDLFRAQLVCEIVNTVGPYFTRGPPKDKLNRFLAYYQRYLMSKQSIPMHIEFTILDMFDNLEELARSVAGRAKAADGSLVQFGPHYVRYDNLETVQSVIDEMEAKRLLDLQLSGGVLPEEGTDDFEDDVDDMRHDIGNTNFGHAHGHHNHHRQDGVGMSTADGDTRQGLHASGDDELDGDEVEALVGQCLDDETAAAELEEEELAEEQEQLAEEESEREAARLLEKMRIAEEDDEFEKAFRTVMLESVESAGKQITGVTAAKSIDLQRMAVPAVLPKPKNMYRTEDDDEDMMMSRHSKHGQPHGAAGGAGGGTVFKLLSRDHRGRLEARQFLVPEENIMAVKLQQSEQALKVEMQRLKERVLQIESLSLHEDYVDNNDFGLSDAPLVYDSASSSTTPSAAGRQAATSQHSKFNDQHSGGPTASPHSSSSSSSASVATNSSASQAVGAMETTGRGKGFAGGRVNNIAPSSSVPSSTAAASPGAPSGAAVKAVAAASGRPSGGGGGGGGGGGKIVVAHRHSDQQRKPPPDTLNLDQFLAESSAAEMRRVGGNGRLR